MIDDIDASGSTLRLLVSQALKNWNIEAVLGLIVDEDHIVRTAAARELQLRGSRFIYEQVIMLITDDRAYVREICAFILGQLGTPDMPYKDESYPLLLDLLEDKERDVRMAAAAALGHISFANMPINVEKALILASKDKDENVRACVAYALGNSSGGVAAKFSLNQLKNDKDESVRSYADLGFELLIGKSETRSEG